jgi:hypothetical protein
MTMKCISCCMGMGYRLRFSFGRAAGVLIALQMLALRVGSAATQSLEGSLELNAGNVAATNVTVNSALEKGGQVNVKTSGAVGDGITDDTAAFNTALKSLADAGGGTCLVPKGTYVISASGITSRVKTSVHLVGEGHTSILKIAAMPTGPLIVGDGNNWSIENLTLDMQDYSPSRIRPAIRCRGDNWRVANCSILKMGRIGITVFGGNNWSIEKNHITKTIPAQTLNQSILVTKERDTRATNARIIDNSCEGSGILFWGFNSTIARNRINNVGFGSGICTGRVGNCHTIKVIGNTCTGGRGFDENRTWVSGFELWAPNSVIASNTAYDNDGTGIIVGGQNCIVVGNHSYNNGVHPERFGFGARYAGPVNNASGSIFIGNRADDTRYPGSSATQAYGYLEQPGGLHDIVHIGNDYNRNRIRPAKYNSIAGQANVSTNEGSRVIQARLSSEMKGKLKTLADDPDLPDNARRALRECLTK